jgi:cytochrome c peroxidase
VFFDQNLSGGKNMACATCHNPQYAYGPPNSLSVQLGSDPSLEGQRAVPSLRCKSMTPPYNDVAENPDGITQNAPGGYSAPVYDCIDGRIEIDNLIAGRDAGQGLILVVH